jgi:hypothetical protein
MGLRRRELARRVLLLLFTALLAILLVSSVKYLPSPQSPHVPHTFFPKPPLLTEESRFPCLESSFPSKQRKRFVLLHGPDWEIESVINPKCLPEHELVFSTQVGRHFLRHPTTHRLRFWVARKNDLICVKGWDSSGDQQLDDTALELVTNHHCENRRSKDCRIQMPSSALFRID